MDVSARELCFRLRDLRIRLLELSLKLGHLAIRLIDRCLKWPRVDLKQKLALLNERAFFEILSQQITCYLRFDLGVDHPVGGANPFIVDRNVGLLEGNNFHFERRRRGCCRVTRTRETQHGCRYKERYDCGSKSKYFVFC